MVEYKKLSDAELINHCKGDATEWAKAFSAIHGGNGGLLLGWFANAMEAACRYGGDHKDKQGG